MADRATLQVRISTELDDKLIRIAEMWSLEKNDVVRFALGQFAGTVLDGYERAAKNVDVTKLIENGIKSLGLHQK